MISLSANISRGESPTRLYLGSAFHYFQEGKGNMIPGPRTSRLLCFVLSALFALTALPNCAYFNTFYLAKRNFNDGERFRKL